MQTTTLLNHYSHSTAYIMKLYFSVLPAATVAFTAFVPSNNVRNMCGSTKQHTSSTKLFGIMDEVRSDNFILGESSDDDFGGVSSAMNSAYEQFLAELVFSPNDPRLDIIENYDRVADEQFLAWLDQKVNGSTDPEEKLALKDLRGMVDEVTRSMEVSRLAKERQEKEKQEAEAARLAAAEASAEDGKALSDTDLLKRANKVNTAGVDMVMEEVRAEEGPKKNFLNSELTPEIRMSYEALVKDLLPPYKGGESADSAIFVNYDRCDAQLVKVLAERVQSGDEDSKEVLQALAREQQKRLAAATEKLKGVLSAGDPLRMEGVIVKLGKEGQIDEPFLLLLEANANQAKAAGALGPAQLMMKLKQRAAEEKDKNSGSKEIKLLRKLLREESSEEREKILEDAFTPRERILVEGTMENAQRAADGEAPEEEKPVPDVPPPDFINCCKAVMLNFGNLNLENAEGESDLSELIKDIANEAEIVATKIYGKGMTVKEQQDRAWSESSTSIFDLERLELEAASRGETAPWANDDDDEDLIPGFDASGKMQIGGN